MRGMASMMTLIIANLCLVFGWAFHTTDSILAGIGFAILYLAIEFRHFHEDMLRINSESDD